MESAATRQQQHACSDSSAQRIHPAPSLTTKRIMLQLHKGLLAFSGQLTKQSFISETAVKIMLN